MTSHISSAFASPTFGKDGSFEVDKPVGSMSISPCGRDVVLASRQGLHIIDLDSPFAPPRHLPHRTPWEVADVQWSPFPSRDYWVVSTSNQKALVWNLAMSTPHGSVEHYLHAHNRAITDINFSAHHPDMLATCAVDSFVHCWDLRRPARPAITFCDWFAGATQVKWNRQDSHVIASAHDKFLRIWDDRQGAYPLHSIEAHDTKIYGVDWNRTRSSAIVTCSLDKTIKFWDYSKDIEQPERILRTPFPVWRARHTPFGWGILAMPQRGDHNLYLYDRRTPDDDDFNGSATSIKRFEGHEDQVKEFLWRPRGSIENGVDNREFQLVSWGADRFLRLHSLDDEILNQVGYEKGQDVDEKYNLTRKNAPYRTFREDPVKLNKGDPNGASTSGQFHVGQTAGLNTHCARRTSMLPSPSTIIGGWDGGDFLAARAGMRVKRAVRKDVNPIAWMKGVRIGKKEPGLDQSIASTASPNFRNDKDWDSFESLGEEITHVGSKFKKVEFYDVNVESRFVKLSMHGLWGPQDSSTFIDCRFDFPQVYPGDAVPRYAITKTSSIDDQTISSIKADVKTISDAYLSVRRSSFEALIRYLQGDETIEDALAWIKDGQDSSILEFPDADGASSSDEEDELGGYTEAQNDEFGLAGSGILNPSNANANVPLPKACGAMWAENGQLVCFFPPKEERGSSLMESLGLDAPSLLSKGRRKGFEGFGKLHRGSTTKSKASSAGTFEDSGSESEPDSSDSDSSSSDSSTSSRNTSAKGLQVPARSTFRTDVFNFSGIGTGAEDDPNSVEGISMSRSGAASPKTFVSIHKLDSILPSKRRLAERYINAGPNACKRNAEVAREEGFEHLTDVWLLMNMILHDKVPLESMPMTKKHGSVSTFQVLNTLKSQNGKGITDVSKESSLKMGPAHTRGYVKWGQHPFGNTQLVQDLFSYFRLAGDIQMLAMMSCIFIRSAQAVPLSRANGINGKVKDYDVMPPHLAYTTTKTESTPSSYYPSLEVASSLLQLDESRNLSQMSIPGAAKDFVHQGSSLGTSNGDHFDPSFIGLTSPSSYRFEKRSPDHPDSAKQGISASPERLRQPYRSNSSLTSTFVASIPRPFSFSTSASSSPPNHSFLKKRSSPVGTYGALQQSATWGTPSLFGKSLSSAEEPRSVNTTFEFRQDRSMDAHKGDRQRPGKTLRTKINLMNQDQFQNDGYSDDSLLGNDEDWNYRAYRSAYADLLMVWELPIARAEILKFNGSLSRTEEKTPQSLDDQASLFSIKKKVGHEGNILCGSGKLELRSICPECGESRDSEPGISVPKCSTCHSRSKPLTCVLCAEAIRGRAIPCMSCGHVIHAACRLLISQEPILESGTATCAAGCGCVCNEHAQLNAAWLLGAEEEVTAPRSSAPSTIRRLDGEDTAGEEDKEGDGEGDEDSAWEDVAYESLAKNLGREGKRYVKPRESRVLKGREGRASSMTSFGR